MAQHGSGRSRNMVPALLGGLTIAGLVMWRMFRRDTAAPDTGPGQVPGPLSAASVRASTRVERPRAEVYAYWRRLDNLGQFMKHVQSVTPLTDVRSRWVVHVPGLGDHSWEAEITDDEPGHHIAWKSLPDSEIATEGQVRFRDRSGDGGTAIEVRLSYRPIGGQTGRVIERFLRKEIDLLVREDLRRFKAILETGEVPTKSGQSDGRKTSDS